jgi:hypothetical protein
MTGWKAKAKTGQNKTSENSGRPQFFLDLWPLSALIGCERFRLVTDLKVVIKNLGFVILGRFKQTTVIQNMLG